MFKASVVMARFDLPAKAAALCTKQFNGEMSTLGLDLDVLRLLL